MNDIIDLLSGLDKKKEIFDLWYEVHYLRVLLSHIVSTTPSLMECVNEGIMEGCKAVAQEEVKKRFPNFGLSFPTPEEIEELKKKSAESLKQLLQSDPTPAI